VAADPVAPMRAAILRGRPVDLDEIGRWVAALEQTHVPDTTVIETAGGLFTPLTTQHTNLDLGLALAPQGWILVARNRLGVLHDVIATVTASRVRGCSPAAVIFGAGDDDPPPHNARDLATFLGVRVIDRPSDRALLDLFDL
jgi:dethiobiotin synthetase